ncbi:hypothetical protein [Marilutibacter spongiae]|uniref:Uncharacterized protein n=1 Tax=Marilutibacter spongiae TaxID=2025720 RepID=A0A7W3TJQ2_9GAMM|nr:hypothetical protein [Lysobacter spongiae]MBB1059590.1 hypothetical protein [Lysobacter spongiae]
MAAAMESNAGAGHGVLRRDSERIGMAAILINLIDHITSIDFIYQSESQFLSGTPLPLSAR